MSRMGNCYRFIFVGGKLYYFIILNVCKVLQIDVFARLRGSGSLELASKTYNAIYLVLYPC